MSQSPALQLEPELLERFEAMLPSYGPEELEARTQPVEPLDETEARMQVGSVKHAIFMVLRDKGVQVTPPVSRAITKSLPETFDCLLANPFCLSATGNRARLLLCCLKGLSISEILEATQAAGLKEWGEIKTAKVGRGCMCTLSACVPLKSEGNSLAASREGGLPEAC